MFCQSSKNLVCSNGLQSSKIGWQPAQNRWILWKETVQLNEYDTEGRLIRESTPELLYRLSCTYVRAGKRDGREEQYRDAVSGSIHTAVTEASGTITVTAPLARPSPQRKQSQTTWVIVVPRSLHPGYGGIHNYENIAGVRDNDYLTPVGQTIEDGSTNKKKGKCNKKWANIL